MAFANPKPLEVDEVRAFLSDDEALVLFFDAPAIKPEPDETFVWVVTKTDLRWMRADLGPRELQELVAGLRCGLDASSWSGAGEKLCQSTLGSKYTSADSLAGKPLPYDPLRAFALYKALFGHLSDTIKNADGTGKHLLLVPFGALQTFPFQAALTDLPAGGAKPAWLMRRHAITVLPSVASLQALRAHPHSKIPGRKPYVAFANPVLLGRNTSEDKARATLAAAKKDCATVTSLAEIAKLREAFSSAKIEAPSLGSVADVSELRHLAPVPQTADLACAVAKALGASEDDIHLSARATEAAVKASSSSGALASYAVVNFATHGAIAGELTSSAEPGLVLTPPETASEQDDGYLSASEVAALKLNADWVVLAACNTAAGEVRGAEALSGLARAFFYAGARAILVSHWSVREDAAAVLVTDAIGADASNKPFGRAEALRRSMLALADSPDPVVAHPAYWAPFIVVGEGSTR
jgi:CHAT domain-containing protein